MVFIVYAFLAISLSVLVHSGRLSSSENDLQYTRNKNNFARDNVNTNILTLFNYNGNQIYIYNSLANEHDSTVTPWKWIFYYVPIMTPLSEPNSPWVWSFKNEVRVKLMLGDSIAEEMARKAIEKKYDSKTAEYSKYWDIAPLLIDSLTTYIVQGSSSPIVGVEPYHATHPNSLIMVLQFQCSTHEQAQQVAEMLYQGEYRIEIAFYFTGFHQIKTIVDGSSTNVKYIHLSQIPKFIDLYNENIQKMINNGNSKFLYAGLEETFISLMMQITTDLSQTRLNVEAYEQIWNSSDLNPYRITSMLNKIFIYNKTATEIYHDDSIYFNINWQQLKKLAQAVNTNFWKLLYASLFDFVSEDDSMETNVGYEPIVDKQIYDRLQKHDIHVKWMDKKLEIKSFNVFTIRELTDRLQTAFISKQMIVDKKQGAITRIVSATNALRTTLTNTNYGLLFFLTGEVRLYASVDAPPAPWLLCNGTPVLRIQYPRLFSVIGERYGPGDGVNTFNLPDFRGRVPLGVDANGTRVKNATNIGQSGGYATHQIALSELPSHNHTQGSLYLSSTGDHSHSISDPGHNHGGKTGTSGPMGDGTYGMTSHGYGSDHVSHAHTIDTDYTRIQIQTAGNHTHTLNGQTGLSGNDEAFSIIQPYQTINYIIYAA